MQISGIIVHAKPKHAKEVSHKLSLIEGVEVHAVSDEGKLIVTLEAGTDRELADKSDRFQDIEGVLSAVMVYHHYEEVEENQLERGPGISDSSREVKDANEAA